MAQPLHFSRPIPEYVAPTYRIGHPSWGHFVEPCPLRSIPYGTSTSTAVDPDQVAADSQSGQLIRSERTSTSMLVLSLISDRTEGTEVYLYSWLWLVPAAH